MEIKITKRELLESWNTSMSTGWKYLIYGRIINDDNTRYRKFKFILTLYGEDFSDYLNPDADEDYVFYRFSDAHKTEYFKDFLNEMIFAYTDLIKDYSADGCKDFYEACNDSIRKYNDDCRRAYEYDYNWRKYNREMMKA